MYASIPSGPLDPEVLVPNRAADLAFTLDELTAGALDGLKLDLDRVAVGGHSIGGASAHRTLAADDRFDAGFNLDGTFFALDPGHVNDPFLIVGAQEHGQPGEDETWDEAWSRLCGWKRWITVEGSGHSTFTDRRAVRAAASGSPRRPRRRPHPGLCDRLRRRPPPR